MKKLVLFSAVVLAVALTACNNKKEEAPVVEEATVETVEETPAPEVVVEEVVTEEAPATEVVAE